MRQRRILPEREDCYSFTHKPSEINYGGKMKFHQAAFLPAHDQETDFETAVFRVLNRFAELIQERAPKSALDFTEWHGEQEDIFNDDGGGAALVFKAWHAELTDIFFDQWSETPLLNLHHFQAWIKNEVMCLAGQYRRLRMNAVIQEQAAGIYQLNYYASLAMTTLIAEMISEYFEKQMEQLGKMATLARYTIGRCLHLVFTAIEESETMQTLRNKEKGTPAPEEPCLRLLNPFVLGYLDVADIGMVEEIMAGPNAYQLSHTLRIQLTGLFKQVLAKSKHYEAQNLKRCLANPKAVQMILDNRRERNRLLRALRRDSELRVKIVMENVRREIRQALREYLRLTPHPADVLSYIANERQMEDILTKPAVYRRFCKAIRAKRSPTAEAVVRVVQEGIQWIRKSRRNWLGRLSKRDLLEEIKTVTRPFTLLLAHTEDFQMIRSKYGRDSNQGIKWQGIRIWRIQEMAYNPHAKSNAERLLLVSVLEKRQEEISNHFTEGNMFLFRSSGEIYPQQQQRRGRVVFLFADLRNSTETTMKLSKDTASFLTPYLAAVNTSARQHQGKRIYFAGDGYAAYYEDALDAIRAAYTIAAQFNKLRKLSGEEHVREAKEIYQAAISRGIDVTERKQIKQILATMAPGSMPKKVEEFLLELSRQETSFLQEETIKRILSKIAAVYAMPRVDVGMALTNGELFFALVDDDPEKPADKIPIVISPQLTQAARLSGSSDVVKNYIETHFNQPVPFNAYVWDKMLYNRGIVITEELMEQLRLEADILPLAAREEDIRMDQLFFYPDQKLQRRIIIRENAETVRLKGIDKPCRIYEVASPGSYLDKKYGAPGW
ncbi:adenylate/guanylate cyclase domain-containing protein [candidate division FCPU426 bacterium]|nr:adenylate/guanylate cyclase domain-containing protein [candidate division FCPU426 bacterium]